MRERRFAALAVCVLIGVLLVVATTGTAAAQHAPRCSTVDYDGDGTEANPYEVESVDQLQCIEEQGLEANYRLIADIDASETSEWNDGAGFEPVGGFDSQFTGTFDGANHTITGLTIDRPNKDRVGLFGSVNRGEIRDVNLVDVDIAGSSFVSSLVGQNVVGVVRTSSANGSVEGSSSVGGLVGENFEGVVHDSSANSTVDGSSSVGGLVGHNNAGTVARSYATGSFDGSSSVGGLVGFNQDTGNSQGRIIESYATGAVNGSDSVGGLVGYAEGIIRRSYATGAVNGSASVGGLVGMIPEGTIKESYATGSVNGTKRVGGLVGEDAPNFASEIGSVSISGLYWDMQATGQSSPGTTPSRGEGLTTSEMTGSAARGNMTAFDFTSTWKTVPDGYPVLAWQVKDGDDEDIDTRDPEVLRPLCSRVAVNYEGEGTEANPYEIENVDQLQCMTQHLDANYTLVSDIDASETSEWDGGDGFEPIGDLENSQFTGTFDGAGYSITNLSIRSFRAGLFAVVGSNGTVKNVNLENVDVVGQRRNLKIDDSEARGKALFVSTLVASNQGTVLNSSASGKIQARLLRGGGGLVGMNSGTVTGSSASVSVSADAEAVGGLVGRNSGTIEKSYASGSVTGAIVGGLVGRNSGTIEKSYASGNVDGGKVGGLVGQNGGTVTDAYWDMNATGQNTSAGGTGLTTEEMTCEEAPENMEGFDFTSMWVTTSKYPALAWQVDDSEMRNGVDCVVEEDDEGDGSSKEMSTEQNKSDGSEVDNDSDEESNASNESSQPTPGFTALAALLALAAGVAAMVRRER